MTQYSKTNSKWEFWPLHPPKKELIKKNQNLGTVFSGLKDDVLPKMLSSLKCSPLKQMDSITL